MASSLILLDQTLSVQTSASDRIQQKDEDDPFRTGEEITAILKNVKSKGLKWRWTADGYPAHEEYKDNPGGLNVNDTASIFITGKKSNGYVYATVISHTNEPVIECLFRPL